jgi:hypothetical protein
VARIPYRVDDATEPASLEEPGNWEWVYVTVDILKGSKSLQRLYGSAPCNVDLIAHFRCSLPKGRYNVKITATDLAGNTQTKSGVTQLTVVAHS